MRQWLAEFRLLGVFSIIMNTAYIASYPGKQQKMSIIQRFGRPREPKAFF